MISINDRKQYVREGYRYTTIEDLVEDNIKYEIKEKAYESIDNIKDDLLRLSHSKEHYKRLLDLVKNSIQEAADELSEYVDN